MKTLACMLALVSLAVAQTPTATPIDKAKFLVGEWEAKFKQTGLGGKEEQVTATVTTRLALQGQMIQMEETQKVVGKETSSTLLLITFDADAKLYRAFVYTSGLPWTQLNLSGNFEGDKLTLSDDLSGEAGAQFSYERLEEGKYRFVSSVKNGATTFRDQADYTKIAPRK